MASPTTTSPAPRTTRRSDAAGSAPTERRAVAEPPRRFATLWAALTYAVATLTLAYPALAGRFLVSSFSDQYIAGYAFREFAAAWLRAGRGFPQWNPYQFGGMPYVAAMHGDVFYPTFLLRLVMPTDAAMTWGFVIHVFLAGLLTYLFLRALGLGFFGALVGGLAYMLGGNVAGLVSPGHDGKLFVAALLPLVLLFLLRGVRDGRAWAWGGLAISVMLAVLSPHPQLLQYLLLTAGAFALYVAFGMPAADAAAAKLPRPVALRRLAFAAGAVLLGLLGGAIQFWPVFEYAGWSPRAGGREWEHAVSYSMPPEELLNTYLPQFSGMLERYWGRNYIHFHSEYVGAAVLVLAGLAFGTPKPWRRTVWFWTGVLVVSTLWALGGFTPFYRLVYALVPGTKFFRAPSTMLYVVSFCTAVLAGFGAERVLGAARAGAGGALPRPRYAVAWVGVALAVALLATFGVLTDFGASLVDPERAALVDANAGALTLGAWRSFLVVALAAGVVVGLARGALPARAAAWALAALVAADLWSVVRSYWRFSPPAAQLYAGDAVIDYLKKVPQPGRVVPIAVEPLAGTIRDPFLGSGTGKATGLMVHGIRSVVGYHGNELGRYDLLTGWESEEYLNRLGSRNVRRLTNLRYLYTNTATAPIEGLRRVAGPARNATGNMVYLYEFPEDNPAAWVAPLAVKAPDDQVLATVLDQRFDVRQAALFDTAAAVPTQAVPPALPPALDLPVRATRWEPGRISLALDRPAPESATLVVSENYYPGWSATVDGRPAVTGRVNYVLIGVALPAGARQVELSFADPRYATGKAVTLLALLLGFALIVGGIVLERRKSRAAS